MKYLKKFEAFDQSVIDELINKGWSSLTSKEKDYLKNPNDVELTIPKISEPNNNTNLTYRDTIDYYMLELNLRKTIGTEYPTMKNEYSLTILVDANGDGTLDKKVFNGYIIYEDDEYVMSEFEDAYEYMQGYEYELDQFFENAFYEINK